MVEDFETTVNYLKQFVFSYPMSSPHTVAAVAGPKIGPEMIMDSQGNTAELHWHQPEEWDLLSSELKDIIHAHCPPKPPDAGQAKGGGKGRIPGKSVVTKNTCQNKHRKLAHLKAKAKEATAKEATTITSATTIAAAEMKQEQE